MSLKIVCFIIGAGTIQMYHQPPPLFKKKVVSSTTTTTKKAAPVKVVSTKTSQPKMLSDCPILISPISTVRLPHFDLSNEQIIAGEGPELKPGMPFSLADEPAFAVSGVIPELDTWAYLIAGFGLVGVSLRKNRVIV